MSREKRKPPGGGRRAPEYGIVARFADGSCSYYYVDDRFSGLERWGRASQAARFPTEADARRAAAQMQTNSAVIAYEASPLPRAGQEAIAPARRTRARYPNDQGSQRSG